MPDADTPSVSSPRILLVLVAALVAAGGYLAFGDRGAGRPGTLARDATLTPTASPEASQALPRTARSDADGGAPGTSGPSSQTPDDVPPGVSAEQWRALVAELRQRPDGAAELTRLRAYMVWSDAVERWRADPGNAALAAEVRAGLPERLARREVSAPEARLLEGTLLATLEPDAARRAQALRSFDAALPAPAVPDARERAYQQAQAAAVAAWRATPVSQRDPAALNTELQRLRRQHFAQTPTAANQETPR